MRKTTMIQGTQPRVSTRQVTANPAAGSITYRVSTISQKRGPRKGGRPMIRA